MTFPPTLQIGIIAFAPTNINSTNWNVPAICDRVAEFNHQMAWVDSRIGLDRARC